jgi:hypothetical protein
MEIIFWGPAVVLLSPPVVPVPHIYVGTTPLYAIALCGGVLQRSERYWAIRNKASPSGEFHSDKIGMKLKDRYDKTLVFK